MKLSSTVVVFMLAFTTAQEDDTEPFLADFSPIVAKGDYSILLQAITDTGADAVISGNAPVTILGPWDEAFSDLSDVFDTISTEDLASILLDHVIVDANVTTETLAELGCIETKSKLLSDHQLQ